MFATGETVGLAEWIIDDTCLVIIIFPDFIKSPEKSNHVKDFTNVNPVTEFPLKPKFVLNEYVKALVMGQLIRELYMDRSFKQLQQNLNEALQLLQHLTSNVNQEVEPERNGIGAPHHKLVHHNNGSRIKIGEPVPGSAAIPILIATTWRSGSTFLGDLINSYPGTFYFYEPLHYNTKTNSLTYVKDMLDCKIEPGYVEYMRKNDYMITRNWRWGQICGNLILKQGACLSPELMRSACELYPIRLIKSTRLLVNQTRHILSDSYLPNFKVISLFRDPRGIMNSRKSLSWCRSNKDCGITKNVCEILDSNTKATFELANEFPGRIHLVRYEDLSLHPKETTEKIFKFLRLSIYDNVNKFLDGHTKSLKGSMEDYNFITNRNSSATVFAWRSKIDFKKVEETQKLCNKTMQVLGYKMFHDSAELRNESVNPLEKSIQEVWR